MFRSLAPALLALAAAAAQAAPEDVRIVTTYESAGVSWAAPGTTGGCAARYRKRGETAWRDALELWYDARNNECRGSIVYLQPGTEYEAQLTATGGKGSELVAFRTWPAKWPVAKTVTVASRSKSFDVKEGGTAAGYVVYEGNGAVIDLKDRDTFNIYVQASYVIIRGFVLKGAKQDGIRIAPGVTDVVIEDNDISGWGRKNEKWGADTDSGIKAYCHTCPMTERITIQRNRIHDPRYGANSWSEGHPQGPQAITIGQCGGRVVIRGNEMFSRNGNKFNDVVSGDENFSKYGFPNADSDIYDNVVSDAWDDGIEAEGGNQNVRIWGNRIDNTGTGIATTVTSVGPLYIFRNTWARNRFYGAKSPDEDDRQAFFKAGSDAKLGYGRRYLFHNTMLQPLDPRYKFPMGGGLAISGTGKGEEIHNTWSINNIYHLWKENSGLSELGSNNVFRNDLILTKPGASHADAKDRGVRIPNFNDDFAGPAPDIGATEAR
ncbi:MAG TPA: right-handed parallel beta-helix repeat-containing protein [Usitatibacter sp.]|nr:right-handed parallel beta-helix repeat-containing protein [Usitatibacter sp.]